ncbi:4-(cytidine 5'-diphospho)-2-C-methyl-D-erythritol kinase [Sulfitobacter sp. S190]|uniref:4-(cytidine 5'-diphospho)-2-C-methyl-D-erythritol kinase n=1 Tax=Sulfitobacter sp. S190 TaxID=2867022 RepID=UPI0021A3415E|nr:4-(cytidine 5'-diphospho)-2-C-methyl-D-erythritol kinase [Sulfitobacter sp. S190]UWR23099.1 4-(cytidine 5'-diphospho)-2-C-methyl-D-erythritol kinase [Sulfitobacter sp. S190]
MTIEAFAPAKINLTLHVKGQRADGYHLLDSLVVFADIGDTLTLTPAERMSLTVDGPFAKGVPCDARNLVWQAAVQAGWTGQIKLTKNLPHGAGIGGGSSDAAAVLRSLDRGARALELGADVPVCLSNGPQRMQGIGEVLTPIEGLPDVWLLLVNPGAHVPTPAVFRALPRKDNAPMPDTIPSFADALSFVDWLADQRNDMQAAAATFVPAISDVLDTLNDALLPRMSGSGATCFGVYATAAGAQAAQDRIAKMHPDWWVARGRMLR